MKIKRSPVTFHHVISAKAKCKPNEWHQTARELRNAIIKNGLYATGPIIFQVFEFNQATREAEYVFYLPVSEPVRMPDNYKFGFIEQWKFDDGLVLRHADLDEDMEESYGILRACAEANQIQLQEPFYNIYLDVYGDGIIDIYAPIVPEKEEVQWHD